MTEELFKEETEYDFHLKNGEIAKFKIQSFKTIDEICKKFDTPLFDTFEGFHYMSKAIIESYKQESLDEAVLQYKNAKNLSQFEIQNDRNLLNCEYHKFITANIDNDIVGFMFLAWINPNQTFWRYNEIFTDVRKDFQNNGIASILAYILDNSEFLKEKIFERSRYSEDGLKYLNDNKYSAKNYAFILEENDLKFVPKKFGKN